LIPAPVLKPTITCPAGQLPVQSEPQTIFEKYRAKSHPFGIPDGGLGGQAKTEKEPENSMIPHRRRTTKNRSILLREMI